MTLQINSLLKSENKIINQIQSILQSKKAKSISKQAIRVVKNLAMAFKDNSDPNKKVYSDKK